MKKIIIVLLLITLLACILVGGMVVYAQIRENELLNTARPELGLPYGPNEFVTNVKDSRRYLKTSIVIEAGKKKDIDFMDENAHRVRDIVLGILRNLSEKEIKSINIQKEIKQKICTRLKADLGIRSIKDVYFNEFVYQ